MVNLSANARGAVLMMASMASFTINDAFMKAVSSSLPLAQAVVLRGFATVGVFLILAWCVGGLTTRLSARDWKMIMARNVAEVLIAYLFITAIFNMAFANATAILQVIPLTITLAGLVFLNEPVGWRRLSAILVGFCGVLLIVRPGFEGFNIYSIYVVLAVLMVTVRDLIVRRMSRSVPTMTIALTNALSVTVVFGIWSLFIEWAPMTPRDIGFLGAAAVMVAAGYFCAIATMRHGEIAVVSPFRYSALLWALGIGFFFFGEWPDTLALIGGFVVVATGVYAFYRERHATNGQGSSDGAVGTVDKG